VAKGSDPLPHSADTRLFTPMRNHTSAIIVAKPLNGIYESIRFFGMKE
jgi:hypothetical protein